MSREGAGPYTHVYDGFMKIMRFVTGFTILCWMISGYIPDVV